MVIVAQDANNIPRLILTDAAGRVYVLLSDGTTTAYVCPTCLGVAVFDADKYLVSQSNMWMSSYKWAAVAAGASVYFHIKVGATKNACGHFVVMNDVEVTVEFFEAPTLATDGTALTEPCLNRETTAAPITQCFRDPNVTVDGTQLEIGISVYAGRLNDAAGAQHSAGYWLLKKSESYLVKVTNNAGNARDIAVAYTWHEE